MLLPVSPFDLLPFFWRVPAHTKRRANPFATFSEVFGPDDDPHLLDTLAAAFRRNSGPSREHVERLARQLARIARIAEVDQEVLASSMMAMISRIEKHDLSLTAWPQAVDGLKSSGLTMLDPSPGLLKDFLDYVGCYAALSDNFREAALAADFRRCREMISEAPFAGTATADFVQCRLDSANDPKMMIHAMGLLFPLSMVDLLSRISAYGAGDIFAFAPVSDRDGQIIRPMRRMMDRLHAETGCTSQKDTFRALFWTHGPLNEIDGEDWRLPTLHARGWSYRAILPKKRDVPRYQKFGEMIETISCHFPDRTAAFERLQDQFWQVCLYENLLSLCEELRTRVPDIDPTMVFQDVGTLKVRHNVTAARPGPQSS